MKYIKVVSNNGNFCFIKFDSVRCFYINKDKNKIIVEFDGLSDSEDYEINKSNIPNFDEVYNQLLKNIEDSNIMIKSWGNK